MSRSRRHCLVATSAICVLSASSAQAQSPAPARTVAAQGVASVKVVAPKDRKHESPIRAAVEAAEAKALPRAIASARENASELARLSGLALGSIVSISDAQTSPYGPFFGFYGTFGPDRFCGTVRTAVFRTDKKTGKRKRVGSRSRHTCRVPSTVTKSVTVTFAAT
jgi:Protein of unknown function (DUF541)